MTEYKLSFEDYVESFKVLLVGHQWTVTEASKFDGEKLRDSFNKNLHRDDAFLKVFGQKPYTSALPKE